MISCAIFSGHNWGPCKLAGDGHGSFRANKSQVKWYIFIKQFERSPIHTHTHPPDLALCERVFVRTRNGILEAGLPPPKSRFSGRREFVDCVKEIRLHHPVIFGRLRPSRVCAVGQVAANTCGTALAQKRGSTKGARLRKGLGLAPKGTWTWEIRRQTAPGTSRKGGNRKVHVRPGSDIFCGVVQDRR